MKKLVLIWLVFHWHQAISQDSTVVSRWKFSGYIKDLQSLNFNKDFTTSEYLNLVHNRLNVRWNPVEKISLDLELRNRLYWGETVDAPYFRQQLKNQNEAIDLSATWLSTNKAIALSTVERLWAEYRQNRWNLRAGRQRINWGLTNTWNPNDIFNNYNFLDFDYEERPGSDAVKVQYLLNDLSNIEIAAAATKNHSIAAARYFSNYKGFDLQLLTGLYQRSFTAGLGWAGSIADAGFRGEAQVYTATKKDSTSFFNLALEADYIFKNGWYVAAAMLYNKNGLHQTAEDWSKISFSISPQQLMPNRWNILLNTAKAFTPLFNGSLHVVYAPQVKMLILFPAFTYNLQTNLDLDLVWQSFFADVENQFQALSHTGYLRLKWSF